MQAVEWTEIREAWPALIPSMLARWPALDEDRLAAMSGERGDLIAALRETGLDDAEAESEAEAWRMGPMPADAYGDPAHDDASAAAAGDYVPEGEDALSDDRRFGDREVTEPPIGRRDG